MYFHSALRAPASSPLREAFPPPGLRASQPDAAVSWASSSTGRPRQLDFAPNQLNPPSHRPYPSPLISPIRQAVAAEDQAMSSSLCSNPSESSSSIVPHSTPPTSAADTTSPSSRRLELGAVAPASGPPSPAKLTSAKAAVDPKRAPQPAALDRLNLPIPPTSLAFVLPGESGAEAPTMQRYTRKGSPFDARAATIGTGAFGCALRYERGDVFVASMPNGSPDTPVAAAHADAQAASAHDASVPSGTSSAMEREPVENLAEASQEEAAQLLKRKTSSKSLSTAVARRALQEAVEHDAVASVARARSVNSSPAGNSVPLPNTAAARSRLPAVIVVKVCRTPTSGSYDEFPRCGPGRAEAKAADVLLSSGRYIDPDQKHTRIVRGELRMFKFLQAAAAAEGLSQRHTHLVRLIADVSMTQSCELAKLCGDIDSAEATMAATPQPMAGGPPLPRLLVFERLVDLDVMLTPRGWVKNRGLWTVEQVEGVAREVAAGLKFLHAHCLVHGDLKPANLMRCAKTGVVKLIDLGATRRWIRLPVTAKESSTIVEEVDALIKDGRLSLSDYTSDLVCEGLGSLTGSPHFMAPEVLLQAGRYLSADGYARSVLDDYVSNSTWVPDVPSARWIAQCHEDFKRGWGIKSDVWSWGCCVLALLLRTLPAPQRPSSSTVCPFNFSFDESMDDALEPLWPLDPSEETLPRFHLWARLFPLRIMDTLKEGVELPIWADELSAPVAEMVSAAMRHQDERPSAAAIFKALNRPPPLDQLSVRDNASIFSSNLPSPAGSTFSTANSSQVDLTSHASAASSMFVKRLVTLRGPEAPPLPSVPPEVAQDKRVSEPVEIKAPAVKSRSDTLTHRNTERRPCKPCAASRSDHR
ncbi:kinase-like protein [Tilletiopsis washingtonensis]|uniref:Kinase-like protein n=1 Tax=Tilletiopsis washingtonensis TaxID=58919 RepID=A0A316ZB77_9BASI|nr:kinase-like protein [Tilletiopsis washingtonensis]PWN97453.1 kinase-like protein [Tilletiopsis washingtonensis]